MSKFLAVFLSLAIVLLVGAQFFRAAFPEYESEVALYYSFDNAINTEALLVRSEKVLDEKPAGVKVPRFNDGDKIAKNGVVAEYYANESDGKGFSEIKQITAEIEMLKNAALKGENSSGQPEMLRQQLSNELLSVNKFCDSNNLAGLDKVKDSYMTALITRQIVLNKAPKISDTIAKLEAERSGLTAQYHTGATTIKSPDSGYYVREIDGFEGILTPEFAQTADYNTIKDYLKKDYSARNESSGKIITEYNWRLVIALEASKYQKELTAGNSIRVQIPFSDESSFSGIIESVNIEEPTQNVTLVIRCDYMSERLANTRVQSVNLILKNYSGVRIPGSALRIIDGQRGVFIVHNHKVRFKKIEILYSGSDFFISALTQNDSEWIKVYDEVIIKGDNLYDGKTVGL